MDESRLPVIRVRIPGMESLEHVVDCLRAADASITTRHREFEIRGPLTSRQVAAVRSLTDYLRAETGGQVWEVDGAGDLDEALALLCPQAGDDSSVLEFDFGEDMQVDVDDWWGEQQRRQAALRQATR